jgi:hypothetical protein
MDQSKPKDKYLAALIDDGILEIREEPLTTWTAINSFAQDMSTRKTYAFRGHADWSWELETTLGRVADELSIEDVVARELGMIRRFKREFRQYSQNSPAEDDFVQWMSIMRHHGAPSRLLDITFSVYVALYFAISCAKVEQPAALWCFNIGWINEAYDNMAPGGYRELYQNNRSGVFNELFKIVLNDRSPKVHLLNPYEMPARLSRQNGGMLVPTDITSSFYKNLSAMRRCSLPKPWMIKQKLSFGSVELKEAILNLRRMNLLASTLFPGIDGFASSLRMLMTIPEETHTYSERFE